MKLCFGKKKCFAKVEADPRVLEITCVRRLNQGL